MTDLDDRAGKTLRTFARTLFPFDRIGDEYYEIVVEKMAKKPMRERYQMNRVSLLLFCIWGTSMNYFRMSTTSIDGFRQTGVFSNR